MAARNCCTKLVALGALTCLQMDHYLLRIGPLVRDQAHRRWKEWSQDVVVLIHVEGVVVLASEDGGSNLVRFEASSGLGISVIPPGPTNPNKDNRHEGVSQG